jgi:hypothetical protein
MMRSSRLGSRARRRRRVVAGGCTGVRPRWRCARRLFVAFDELGKRRRASAV